MVLAAAMRWASRGKDAGSVDSDLAIGATEDAVLAAIQRGAAAKSLPRRALAPGAGLAAIAAVVLLTSGCGYGGVATASEGDPANGQVLFSTASPTGGPACASCHTLQDAGSSGTIGPNLDNAFAGDRAQGYATISIENVVLDQIRLGSGPIATYTHPEHGVTGLTPQTQMPANLWTGQDAIDIAAYVASVAWTNGYSGAGAPVSLDGASIFKSAGCAGCHTLTAAGATGTVGPDLDTAIAADAKADHNMALAAFVTESIVNPSAYIAHGFTDGIMPAFKGTLSAAQIQAVAQYLVSNTKK